MIEIQVYKTYKEKEWKWQDVGIQAKVRPGGEGIGQTKAGSRVKKQRRGVQRGVEAENGPELALRAVMFV